MPVNEGRVNLELSSIRKLSLGVELDFFPGEIIVSKTAKKYKQRRKGLLHTSLRKGSAWAWHGPRRASPSSLCPGLDDTALDVTGW